MSSLVRERIIKYLRKKHYLALSFLSLVFFCEMANFRSSSGCKFCPRVFPSFVSSSPPLYFPPPCMYVHNIFLHHFENAFHQKHKSKTKTNAAATDAAKDRERKKHPYSTTRTTPNTNTKKYQL